MGRTLGTPTDETWPGFTSLPRYQVSFPNFTKCLLAEKLGDKMPPDAINLLKVTFHICIYFCSRIKIFNCNVGSQ